VTNLQRGLVLLIFLSLVSVVASVQGSGAGGKWPTGKAYELKGLRVTLSAPVLVGRSKTYFWFPQIERLPNGEVLAIVRTCADANPYDSKGAILWSSDEGLTWSEPKPYGRMATSPQAGDSWSRLFLPNGDLLLLPSLTLYSRPHGAMGAPYHLIPKGKREIKLVESGVTFTGFPYFLDPKAPGTCTYYVDGQIVKLRNGKYLAPVYGYLKDFDQQTLKVAKGGFPYLASTPNGYYRTKKYSLAVAESSDGIRWQNRATIADENCPLKGEEGPCESAICRLKDGRLMCLFRMGSGVPHDKVPYGQSWSSDDARTWTAPTEANGPFSVEPSVAVMSGGTVVLAGGRPLIYLWFNTDGKGNDWQEIATWKHHNAFRPKDPITDPGNKNTTAYAEVVAIDDTHLLYIYDRIANGWNPILQGSSETYTIWVVRVTLEKRAK